VAEVGDPRGRREYNVLGDTVNTTARLMSSAQKNQIVVSERVQKAISEKYECHLLGAVSLKGKNAPMQLYELEPQKRNPT
jgi:class 3 adenylate cyclase